MRKFQNILSLSPNQCGPLGDTKTTFFTEFSRSNSEKLIQNLISLETEQKQGRKQVQFIAVEALFTCLFLFDYKPVCLCKRQDMSKNSNPPIASTFLDQFPMFCFAYLLKN